MQQSFQFIGEISADWHLDNHTKIIGRLGIAAARETLANCKSEDFDLHATSHSALRATSKAA